MSQPHIYLGRSIAEVLDFTPKSQRVDRLLPERNILEHASFLRDQYRQGIQESEAKISQRKRAELPHAKGVYLDFELEGDKIPYNSLDTKKGANLLQVGEKVNQTIEATVFLPSSNKKWLTEKLDNYSKPIKEGGKPAEMTLINSIANIRESSVRSLFPIKEEYDGLVCNAVRLFEVWISVTEYEKVMNLRSQMKAIGLSVVEENIIIFESVSVFLVTATKEAIEDIPYALDYVEAIKLYNNPAKMTSIDEDQRDWVDLISESVSIILDEHPVMVGLLDMGVNNGHKLLKEILPDKRQASVVEGIGIGHEGFHGTCMAGLIEYGDLSKYQSGNHPTEIRHALASVKVLSSQNENSPTLYGKLTDKAIEICDRLGAKIVCMAVTEDQERNNGTPTSWSASLDNALYNHGNSDRMLLLSAGNTDLNNIDPHDYIQTLDTSSMPSPTQALNAITVGAYTEASICRREGWVAIAPPQGLSPMTRTSVMWRGKNPKPDIVMEGGNAGVHKILGVAELQELSPVSTNHEIPNRPLRLFNQTSAATALAARLAAKIQIQNPSISILSVRALMIHSAEWTPQMMRLGVNSTQRMRYCGYGVPQEQKALASTSTYATFIFENELRPYNDDGTYREMHFYDLPWPKDLLESMEDETVRMRITLSYYIQPSPGFKSAYNKYKYSSSGLTFDVKTPNETRDQFIARNNKEETVLNKSENDSNRWEIGIKRRSIGTVQSDWFVCSARELAECNQIGIFPSNGWWKNRKIAKIDNRIKYSLIVSIETSETEIYNEVLTSIQNKTSITV